MSLEGISKIAAAGMLVASQAWAETVTDMQVDWFRSQITEISDRWSVLARNMAGSPAETACVSQTSEEAWESFRMMRLDRWVVDVRSYSVWEDGNNYVRVFTDTVKDGQGDNSIPLNFASWAIEDTAMNRNLEPTDRDSVEQVSFPRNPEQALSELQVQLTREYQEIVSDLLENCNWDLQGIDFPWKVES